MLKNTPERKIGGVANNSGVQHETSGTPDSKSGAVGGGDVPVRTFLSGNSAEEPAKRIWEILKSQGFVACLVGQTRDWHYLSDCSGGEAPMFSLESLARVAQQDGYTLNLIHEGCSETPEPTGKQKIAFLKHTQNSDFKNYFLKLELGKTNFEKLLLEIFPKLNKVAHDVNERFRRTSADLL